MSKVQARETGGVLSLTAAAREDESEGMRRRRKRSRTRMMKAGLVPAAVDRAAKASAAAAAAAAEEALLWTRTLLPLRPDEAGRSRRPQAKSAGANINAASVQVART